MIVDAVVFVAIATAWNTVSLGVLLQVVCVFGLFFVMCVCFVQYLQQNTDVTCNNSSFPNRVLYMS